MQLRYYLAMYKQVFSSRQLVETPAHETLLRPWNKAFFYAVTSS